MCAKLAQTFRPQQVFSIAIITSSYHYDGLIMSHPVKSGLAIVSMDDNMGFDWSQLVNDILIYHNQLMGISGS